MVSRNLNIITKILTTYHLNKIKKVINIIINMRRESKTATGMFAEARTEAFRSFQRSGLSPWRRMRGGPNGILTIGANRSDGRIQAQSQWHVSF